MSTPKYEALRAKTLSWSNRDPEVLGSTTTIQNRQLDDFLSYSADEAYRKLRIPPLEFDRSYTIEEADIVGSPNISVLGTNNFAGTGGISYNKILLPIDFIEMVYLRYSGINGLVAGGTGLNPGIVFNERTDERTFFDIYAETYSNFYWMRSGDYLYIKPALPVGSQISFHYYRQLPALNADYSIVPENYLFTTNTNAPPTPMVYQPFLTETTAPTSVLHFNVETGYVLQLTTPVPTTVVAVGNVVYSQATEFGLVGYVTAITTDSGTGLITAITLDRQAAIVSTTSNYYAVDVGSGPLWFVLAGGVRAAAYATQDEAVAGQLVLAALYPTVTFTVSATPGWFSGNEVGNWLKDQNERVLIWGALMNFGAFLDDEKMEARYEKKFLEDIQSLNNEERMRRAKGGNVQTNFNGRGLI